MGKNGVLAENFLTKEIRTYTSLEKAGLKFDISYAGVIYAANKKGKSLNKDGWRFFRTDEYALYKDNLPENGYLVKDIHSGKESYFSTRKTLSEYLDVSGLKIERYMKRSNEQLILAASVIVKPITDRTPWRTLDRLEEESYFGKKSIVVRENLKTGHQMAMDGVDYAHAYTSVPFRSFYMALSKHGFYKDTDYIYTLCRPK